MAFEIISIDNKKAQFIIKDVDVSIVNSLRRIILSEIPNIAFAFDPHKEENDIKMHVNTCGLHNEILGHRISLIPLCFDEDEVENFQPEKYRFVLKKKNTGHEIMSVTTNDFEIYNEDNVRYDARFKNKIFPTNPITKDHILITKLKANLYDTSKGEEVDIEAVASLGIAKNHARWIPASTCTYFNVIDEKAAKQAEASVPPAELNKFHHLDRYRLFKKNKYDEANEFEFTIESECRLSPNYLFLKALSILKSKVAEFISRVTSNTYEVITSNGMHMIQITNETHTLVNVLQAVIYNNTFRETTPTANPLEFIGFHQSHPLDNKMVLKIKFKDETADLKDFLKSQCDLINVYLSDLEAKWKAAA
jgi:DNA-directed RNA polymerase alpha subunit